MASARSNDDVLTLTAEVVSAYVRGNAIRAADVLDLIRLVEGALLAIVAGPAASLILADLGADVIRRPRQP